VLGSTHVRCSRCKHTFFMLTGERAVTRALHTQNIPVQRGPARISIAPPPAGDDRTVTLRGVPPLQVPSSGRATLPEPASPPPRSAARFPSIPPPSATPEQPKRRAIQSSPDLFIEEEHALTSQWELIAPGTMVAGYCVERPIATGGAAVVYAATHRATGVPFAFKVLRDSLAQHEVALARFRQELSLLASIEHPGVVRVHDVGTLVDGRPYIVLDWLDGACLGDWISGENQPTPEEAFTLFGQLCEALAAVHDVGIVHRDLKPENVFVARPGGRLQAKLLDFGAAKLVSMGGAATGIQTRPGVLIGSPAYMSPEQLRGEPIDARADLFALGIILYETFGGEWPWATQTLWGNLDTRTQKPARRSERLARRSPALEALVMRCLAMRPEDRPASARALRRELENVRPEWPARVRNVGHVGIISLLRIRARK
jgi:serine/threonine-protein kinase